MYNAPTLDSMWRLDPGACVGGGAAPGLLGSGGTMKWYLYAKKPASGARLCTLTTSLPWRGGGGGQCKGWWGGWWGQFVQLKKCKKIQSGQRQRQR